MNANAAVVDVVTPSGVPASVGGCGVVVSTHHVTTVSLSTLPAPSRAMTCSAKWPVGDVPSAVATAALGITLFVDTGSHCDAGTAEPALLLLFTAVDVDVHVEDPRSMTAYHSEHGDTTTAEVALTGDAWQATSNCAAAEELHTVTTPLAATLRV